MLSIFNKNDASLVRRTLNGQREAFSALVERHQELVFAVAYGIVANAADAEDVTQDAFVTAFTKLSALREPAKFRAWLLTIARNRASDVLVKRGRETPLEDSDIPAPELTDTVADAELRILLRDRIDRLPAEYREILLLHYYAGLKVREVAAQLEISTDAAKKRLQRARDLLSQRMLSQLRDTVDEHGSSAARTRTIIGLIAGASAPWLGGGAAAAGTGLLTTAGLIKLAAGVAVGASATIAAVLVSRDTDPPPASLETLATTELATQAVAPAVAAVPESELPNLLPEEAAGATESDSTESVNASGVVRGRVLSSAGTPVAGVSVMADPENARVKDHHEVISDADGRYEFLKLRQSEFYLLQAFGDTTFGAAERSPGTVSEPNEEDIVLLPATELTGVVVDKAGKTLEGIPVRPYKVPINGTSEHILRGWEELRRVDTDATGQFTISHAWPGDWVLKIDAPDYAILHTKELNTSASPHTIRIEKGATVQGRVVHQGTDNGVPSLELEIGDRTTTTDSDGAFHLSGVTAGTPGVQLRGEHNLLVTSAPFAAFPGRETTGVRVEVAVGGVLAGRVTDSETGEPVSQATVYFRQNSLHGHQYDGYTDENGKYEVKRLYPGEYVHKMVSGRGYVTIEENSDESLHVDYGTRRDHINFTLVKGVTISGHVDFPSGESRDEVFVYAIYVGDDGGERSARGSSFSKDGTFSVRGLRRKSNVVLQVRGQGWTSDKAGPFALNNGDIDGVFLAAVPVSTTGGTVSGQVVQGGSLPRSGETVWLDAMSGGNSQTVASDADGAFRFTGVPSGTYRVFIPQYDVEIPNVTVQKGRDTGGLRLDIGGGTGTITGRVVDWRGNAIAEAKINAMGSRNRVPDTTTDDTGRYTLMGVGEESITIGVYAPGFGGEQRERVTASSRNVDFRLKPVGHVEGTVVDARTGKPIQEFSIYTARNPSERSIESALQGSYSNRQVSSEGVFRAVNLAADEHVVFAQAKGYFANYTKVTVVPDEVVAGAIIRLEPDSVRTAMVTDSAGAPIAGAKVFINKLPVTFADEGFNTDVAKTDDSGSAPLENLVPGQNTIYIYHPIQGRRTFTVDTETQQGEIPFELPTPGRIEGTILLNGEPIAQPVQVRLDYPPVQDVYWFSRYTVNTEKDGTFVVDGLMAGTVRMQCHASNGVEHTREFPLVPGETVNLDIDLSGGTGTIQVTVILPEYLAATRVNATATMRTHNGTFKIAPTAVQEGLIEFHNVPAGEADILAGAQTEEGTMIGRHFAPHLEVGGTVELTADFTQGITISGTAGNLQTDQESYALLIAGEVDPTLFSNESYQISLAPRVIHQQALVGTNAYQFENVAPGTYTMLVALDGFGRTAYQVVEVENEDLRIDLTLP